VAVRYATTITLTLLVFWARLYWGAGANKYPFLIFIPVIFACGAFLNRGNGFLASALSAALCAFFLMPPAGSLLVSDTEDRLTLILFLGIGFGISFVVEALHVGLAELAAEHERTRTAVQDRQLLLEELSHRTRNDFANVVTLLSLQARTSNPDVRDALTAAADRVQTIARVHRRLELRNNRVVVDTKSYIGELCADLRLSQFSTRPIAIECNAESHSLSLEKAVPLGLIVNESITNAAKHAFPENRQGIIKVGFIRMAGIYKLTIADNGTGSGNGRPKRPDALGNRLMQLLAGQLDSTLNVENGAGGTTVTVSIMVKTAKPEEPKK
jgi:two-component sensor histidine kinase